MAPNVVSSVSDLRRNWWKNFIFNLGFWSGWSSLYILGSRWNSEITSLGFHFRVALSSQSVRILIRVIGDGARFWRQPISSFSDLLLYIIRRCLRRLAHLNTWNCTCCSWLVNCFPRYRKLSSLRPTQIERCPRSILWYYVCSILRLPWVWRYFQVLSNILSNSKMNNLVRQLSLPLLRCCSRNIPSGHTWMLTLLDKGYSKG